MGLRESQGNKSAYGIPALHSGFHFVALIVQAYVVAKTNAPLPSPRSELVLEISHKRGQRWGAEPHRPAARVSPTRVIVLRKREVDMTRPRDMSSATLLSVLIYDTLAVELIAVKAALIAFAIT